MAGESNDSAEWNAILDTVQEQFPNSVEAAAACTFEVVISMMLSYMPSSESVRTTLHAMVDAYIDQHAVAADEHFARCRPKTN